MSNRPSQYCFFFQIINMFHFHVAFYSSFFPLPSFFVDDFSV